MYNIVTSKNNMRYAKMSINKVLTEGQIDRFKKAFFKEIEPHHERLSEVILKLDHVGASQSYIECKINDNGIEKIINVNVNDNDDSYRVGVIGEHCNLNLFINRTLRTENDVRISINDEPELRVIDLGNALFNLKAVDLEKVITLLEERYLI